MIIIHMAIIWMFVTTPFHSFSQQRKFTDTTSKETDEAGSDTVIADTTGYYMDPVNKAQYNYYNDTSVWTKDTFVLRQVPDSMVNDLQSQDAFWYANKEFKKEKASEPGMNFLERMAGQKWYRVLAWCIVIGGFLAVLIWWLASSNVGIFSRRSRMVEKTEDTDPADNIFNINYQKEIEKAIHENNYRLAVRLMFLRVLKNLAEKNIIQFKQGLTNIDYLLQLNNTAYYKEFFRLSRHYEYMWYGEFSVSNETFSIIKKEFENFDPQLY
jgi:hypothetical protein